MNDFTLNFPFTKVDKVKRTVTGIATAENLDSDKDIMEIGGSIEAFSSWPGNIREMHQPEAVGKMLDFRAPVPVEHEGNIYDGLEVTVYVSKGAENTWQKVLDGTLRGFSIGGGVIEKSVEYDSKTKEVARRVSKYQLVELSLVDNPANPAALVSMFKRNKDNELVYESDSEMVYKSSDDDKKLQSLYYCPTDQVASDASTCSKCKGDMVDIGFIENFDAEIVSKMIDQYELSKNGGVMKLQENTSDDTVTNMDDLTEEQQENLTRRFVKSLFGKSESKEAISQLPNVIVNIDSSLISKSSETPEVVDETIEKNADEDAASEDDASDDSVEKSAKEVNMADETVEKVDETNDTDAIVKALSGVLNDALAEFKVEINKTVDEKIEAVTKSVEETTNKVEKLADDGAVSKSEETLDTDDDSLEKSETIESFWSGHFVPLELVKALGYDS